MTKNHAAQLGRALIAWSENRPVKVRTTTGPDRSWYPFLPGSYEKLNVDEDLEWAVEECVATTPRSLIFIKNRSIAPVQAT
jgi:hypothetical protein